MKTTTPGRSGIVASLEEPWDHAVPLLPVGLRELLAVSPFLLLGPDSHLSYCDDDEDTGAQTPSDQPNSDPRNSLEHVVRARHKVETQAFRDAPLRAAAAAKTSKDEMCVQVAKLSNNKERYAKKSDGRVARSGRGCRRRIAPVCNVKPSEDPVVCGVLEDVAHRHCGIGEAVHVESLQLTLQEV